MTKSWDTYRSIIIDLYSDRTLAEVRQIMQRDYGFEASTRAYRGRLIKWGVRKYNTRRPDGSVSGDEDGDGGSSLSDTESPSPARQQRDRGQARQSRQDHPLPHYPTDRQRRGRGDSQATTPYTHSGTTRHSHVHDDSGSLQPSYLDTSGYPQVSRSSSDHGYSVWNAPDHSPFSPSHSQAPPYSTPFYSDGHSPVYSPHDGSYYDPHHSPASAFGFDTDTFTSFGSVSDPHGSDYGSHQHYRDVSGSGSSHYYADYPDATRYQGQSAGGSRRGHRDRGRG
ncbi:Clr5 domain-domain-containing protein [Microdochium bolleyi]|uniref:Clr5 domain-domain-containing protein n=1 Tax=Microdochium bolleyi TaxID=196109 RepID=A0A136JHZ7_9PEZI|nr:Clr5 domain-domain-containing protein [Microdochium bolleyi]